MPRGAERRGAPVIVLVCTDFSAAAAAGEREASRRFPDATLVLHHTTDTDLVRRLADVSGGDVGRLLESAALYADQRLSEVVGRLASQGRRAVPDLAEGEPVEQALAAAARHRAELIVVGVQRSVEVGRFRTTLLRRTSVPVLLIPSVE